MSSSSPSTSPGTKSNENGILGISVYTIDYNNQIYILVGTVIILLLLCCCSSLVMFMASQTSKTPKPMTMSMQSMPIYPGYQRI